MHKDIQVEGTPISRNEMVLLEQSIESPLRIVPTNSRKKLMNI